MLLEALYPSHPVGLEREGSPGSAAALEAQNPHHAVRLRLEPATQYEAAREGAALVGCARIPDQNGALALRSPLSWCGRMPRCVGV